MSFWGTRPSPFTSPEVTFLQALADHSFTDGQLIIGNTSTGGVSFATITAGSGITVTNAGGTITLAASGSSAIVVGTTTITSGTTTRILYDNAGVVGEYTISGSGTVVAMATSPSFTTPTLGVATATTINGNTFTTGTYTLTGQAGKTLTFNGSITLTGTDAQTYTFPTTSATLARTDAANTFTGHQTIEGVTSTGATGTALLVFATAPTFTTSITLSVANIITDTSTGTKIGTATNQKLGFFNSAPIVQPTGDVITGLQNLGLMASATVLATTITSRTLWGQTYDGSGNVTGSLTAVGSITGGASSMTITAGTGNSRTLALQSTTSGGTATTFLTGNADQTTTFAAGISGTGAWTITGGAGNMTILSGTGASRTLIFQTTTSGSSATTALTLGADQSATFAAGGTFAGAVTIGTSNAFTCGTIELGAASDTTLARVSAGLVSIEGSNIGTMAAAQVWTGQNKFNNIIDVNNAIAASSNAATVPVTFRLNTVTNNSAATLTITMTTTSAVDGQMTIVRILDSSAAAQTIAWVNTENSTVSAPTTSNGSTTLFLTVGFIYNSGTSKWRCIASA